MTKLYPFLSAAVAYLIANTTYQDIAAYPIDVALSPYAYRVLLSNLWPVLDGTIGPFVASWLLYFLCLSLLAFMIDEIGQRVGAAVNTRIMLLASMVIAPVIILFHAAGAMHNAIEAVFYAAALLMILNGRTWALYPLVFVATLNRETAVFIPLMYFLARTEWGRIKRLITVDGNIGEAAIELSRHWLSASGLLFVWAVTYGAIRLIVGPVPVHLTLPFILDINLGAGFGRFVLGLIFVSWLFWYAWKGWRAAPDGLKRAALIIPPYLLLVGVFGMWHEWRLILTIYPLLIPLAAVGMVNNG